MVEQFFVILAAVFFRYHSDKRTDKHQQKPFPVTAVGVSNYQNTERHFHRLLNYYCCNPSNG